MRATLALLVTLAIPAPSDAQAPAATYERARALVESGRGETGRALVDSLLAAAAPGEPAHAEALWWRATLAREGADAERDLRTLVVEYQASPRATDASLRLAQLELARGRPAEARERLERLRREQPDGAARARVGYWLARAQLEAGDPRTACAALNEAAGASLPGDPVARQVVALRRRLPGCELTVAVGSGEVPIGDAAAASGATASAPPAAGGPPQAANTTPIPPPPTPADAPPPPAPRAAPAFTVQLAAYDTRPGADALAARLVARGVDARVAGTAAPSVSASAATPRGPPPWPPSATSPAPACAASSPPPSRPADPAPSGRAP